MIPKLSMYGSMNRQLKITLMEARLATRLRRESVSFWRTTTSTTGANNRSMMPKTTSRKILNPRLHFLRRNSIEISKRTQPVEPSELYSILKLSEFSDQELDERFDQIVGDEQDVLNHENLRDYLISQGSTDISAISILDQHFGSSTLSKEQFRSTLLKHSSTVDYWKLSPIVFSMMITGVSVGIVNPAMPMVVEQLQLSSAEYGVVVSGFAVAKLCANIPAAVVTETYGRKIFLSFASMPLLAIGVGGIGYASNSMELFTCRLLTGTGVALLSTAATLMLTDMSTPKNRASSIAPVMSGFSIGMVVGPGIGGYSMDQFGLQNTFYMVGASYICVGIMNHFLLRETKPSVDTTLTFWNSAAGALSDWKDLLTSQSSSVRNVIGLNAMYWVTLAGAQMTILPLLLTEFSAVDVGHVYMGMSALQIVGNPIFAAASDRIGRIPVLVSGTTLMGGSLFFFDSSEWLMPALGIWSLGSSMLSTAPVAYVSDHVPSQQRAAAIALLRTAGDVGLLLGSAGTGYLAHLTDIPTAMESLAYMIWASTALFGANVALRNWKALNPMNAIPEKGVKRSV